MAIPAPDDNLLLFLWTFENSKFASIAYVNFCGTVRWAGEHYGKKPSLLGGLEQAQYVEVIYSGSPASRKAPYSRSLCSALLYRRPKVHDEREKVGLALRYC